MESQRRPQSTSTSPTPPAVIRPAPDGFFAKYGNTLLTGVLLVAVGVLAYQWWDRSATAARNAVIQQLDTARANVEQLRSSRLFMGMDGLPSPSTDVAARVRTLQSTASGLVADVINKADAPAIKARALIVRGDLAWAVANLPELPGASTQPTLKMDPPADVLLGQCAESYSAVLNLDGAEKESVAAAHLGLAAVAENRGDWATAKQQLQAVVDAKDGVAVLSQAAKAQLATIGDLQKPTYLAPAGGIDSGATPATTAPAAVVPTTRGVMGPVLPPTTAPTVALPPATLPVTRPATVPATAPAK